MLTIDLQAVLKCLRQIKLNGGTMEQKQLKQFTYYELYADILNGLNDVEAGKFAKRICEYEFENAEPTDVMTDKQVFYWSNISDMLEEVKGIEAQGKIRREIRT
ncbi:MAG TPA: hypothetical protein DD415_02935 [Clostridiales bacterium]|nr:hypothetical protein [Clostridiales bacterium]